MRYKNKLFTFLLILKVIKFKIKKKMPLTKKVNISNTQKEMNTFDEKSSDIYDLLINIRLNGKTIIMVKLINKILIKFSEINLLIIFFKLKFILDT